MASRQHAPEGPEGSYSPYPSSGGFGGDAFGASSGHGGRYAARAAPSVPSTPSPSWPSVAPSTVSVGSPGSVDSFDAFTPSGGAGSARSAGTPDGGFGFRGGVRQHEATGPFGLAAAGPGAAPAAAEVPVPEPVVAPGAVSLAPVAAGAPAPAADTRPLPAVDAPGAAGPWQEWDPTEESVRSVRGRHRVAKQRGGMARSGAVLGVGMMAAVGAGGVATAKGKDPAAISLPDLHSAAHAVKDLPDRLPDVHDLPGVGGLLPGGGAEGAAGSVEAARAPLTQAGLTPSDTAAGQTDAGEALRTRILAQAQQQQSAADETAQHAALSEAVDKALSAAGEQADATHKEDAEKKRKAEEEKKRKEEAERLAKLARSFTLPVSSYTLTAGFGQSGNLWQNNHTGQDFAAPTGTPIKALHGGTVKEAGWAGSYGYRTVLELDDGTELWFCHQSSMTVSAGEKVKTGDVIGRVGATGNVTGPHLHLEVRPGGGDPIDPLPWLRAKGLKV